MHSLDTPDSEGRNDAAPAAVPQYPSRREARAAEAATAGRSSARAEPTRWSSARAEVRGPGVSRPTPTVGPDSAKTAPAPAPSPAPSRPARTRPTRTRRALGVAALTIVAGLVATTALPAAASSSPQAALGGVPSASVASSARSSSAQNLSVSASAVSADVVRDDFAAPSASELVQANKQATVLAAAGGGTYTTVSTQPTVDDYPWPDELTDAEGGSLSALGYYYRECVDFVAWRINRDQGSTGAPWAFTWPTMTPNGGSAWEWPDAWAAHGWATSSTPIVGAVAWFDYNHVAYVQAVNPDGTVLIEEYNYGGLHRYGTRTLAASDVDLFLYPPTAG